MRKRVWNRTEVDDCFTNKIIIIMRGDERYKVLVCIFNGIKNYTYIALSLLKQEDQAALFLTLQQS